MNYLRQLIFYTKFIIRIYVRNEFSLRCFSCEKHGLCKITIHFDEFVQTCVTMRTKPRFQRRQSPLFLKVKRKMLIEVSSTASNLKVYSDTY